MTHNPPAADPFQTVEPRLAGLLQSLDAHRIPHSRRSLAEHLVGTRDLLRSWGNDDAVCRAGLFHSIYGTRVFNIRCADFSSRKMVRDVIGEAAESLAYLFCIADRDSFFSGARTSPHVIRDGVGNTDLAITRRVLASLLEIEAANIVEQLPRRSRETRRSMRRYRDAFAGCRDFVTPDAANAIARTLETCTADAPPRAIS